MSDVILNGLVVRNRYNNQVYFFNIAYLRILCFFKQASDGSAAAVSSSDSDYVRPADPVKRQKLVDYDSGMANLPILLCMLLRNSHTNTN